MEFKTIIIIILAIIALTLAIIFGIPLLETSQGQAQGLTQIATSILPK